MGQQIRPVLVAVAAAMLAAACNGADTEKVGTTSGIAGATTELTSATTGTPEATAEPTGAAQRTLPGGVVVTTSMARSRVEMVRVPHGSWFEGDVWMNSIAQVGEGFVAAGASHEERETDAAAWRSTDGQTWERVDIGSTEAGEQAPEGTEDRSQVILDLAYGPLGVVAVGTDASIRDSDGAAWLSQDGLAWERLKEPTFIGEGDQILRSVVQTGERAVAVGESAGQATVWVSNDGREWTQARIDGAPGDSEFDPSAMFDVVAGGPGLVAVGSAGFDSHPAVWLSTEGTIWGRLPDTLDEGSSGVEGGTSPGIPLSSIAARDGHLVTIGSMARTQQMQDPGPATMGTVVWASSDGFEWSMLTPTFDDSPPPGQSPAPYSYLKGPAPVVIADVTWHGGRLIAIGGYDVAPTAQMSVAFVTLWVSLDGGHTWHVGSEQALEPSEAQSGRRAAQITRSGPSIIAVGFDDLPIGRGGQYNFMQYERIAAVWIANLTEE